MNVKTLVLGDYGTNCYILWNEGNANCLVIDPGYEPETVLDTVESLGLGIEAVLLTHGHFDHVGGVRQIAADTGCRVFLNPADTSMPPMMTAGQLYYTDTYQGGEELELAGLKVSVMSTPGHTPGSVCLMCGEHMFSGDTLFAGSCGRTDLPGGDWDTIVNSLSRLKELDADFHVYPGHGSATTLAREKRVNPYMR